MLTKEQNKFMQYGIGYIFLQITKFRLFLSSKIPPYASEIKMRYNECFCLKWWIDSRLIQDWLIQDWLIQDWLIQDWFKIDSRLIDSRLIDYRDNKIRLLNFKGNYLK